RGWAAHRGLPGVELGAGLRSKGPPPRPAPKPAGAPPVRVERPLDRVEAAVGALFLTRPELIRGAAAVVDEVTHPGLRAVLAQLQAGTAPADAVEGAGPRLRTKLEAAQGLLPRGSGKLPWAPGTPRGRLQPGPGTERVGHT